MSSLAHALLRQRGRKMDTRTKGRVEPSTTDKPGLLNEDRRIGSWIGGGGQKSGASRIDRMAPQYFPLRNF